MLDSFLKSLSSLIKLRPPGSPAVVPVYAVLAGAQNRPGLSVTRSLANILGELNRNGIPVGTYPDGTPNANDVQLQAIVTEVFRALHEDLLVTCAVPSGITLNGNGPPVILGGPVTIIGSTIMPVNAYGIVQ